MIFGNLSTDVRQPWTATESLRFSSWPILMPTHLWWQASHQIPKQEFSSIWWRAETSQQRKPVTSIWQVCVLKFPIDKTRLELIKAVIFCANKNTVNTFNWHWCINFCVASWNEDHIAITRWGLSVDIDYSSLVRLWYTFGNKKDKRASCMSRRV